MRAVEVLQSVGSNIRSYMSREWPRLKERMSSFSIQGLLNNRIMNYPFAVFMVFLIDWCLETISRKSGLVDMVALWGPNAESNFHIMVLFGSLAWFIGSSTYSVPTQKRVELLFLGAQTNIFLTEGFWIIPFHRLGLFKPFVSEVVDIKRFTIVMPPIESLDSNGTVVKSTGIAVFRVKEESDDRADERARRDNPDDYDDDDDGETGANKFQKFSLDDIKDNLSVATKSTRMDLVGQKNYYTDILGTNLSDQVKGDSQFKKACNTYGVKCVHVTTVFNADNLKQEDTNRYIRQMRQEILRDSPGLDDHQVEERMQIRLGLAKKIYLDGDASDKARIVVE